MEQLIAECLLQDPDFLDDYVIESTTRVRDETLSLGTIRNTTQPILIRKQRFEIGLLSRFKTQYRLFKEGVILADNMFVRRESQEYFIYTIEAYIDRKPQGKFATLQSLLDGGLEVGRLADIADKVRVLLDKTHREGENYLCLTPLRIIVEDEADWNVQLAPFEINQAAFLQDLRANPDPYLSAYLAPQLFTQILLGGQQRLQLNKKDLITADYWSYGCILLQLFVLASPAFLCSDPVLQHHRFQSAFNGWIKDWSASVNEDIRGLLLNSLEQNPAERSLAKKRSDEIDVSSVEQIERDVSDICESKYNDQSSFSLAILSVSDYQIKEELRIVVNLFTKFTFYADKQEVNNSRILKLDKTVNVDNNFEQFKGLLEKEVIVELEDGSWRGIAKINLGMLVLRHQGKRIWRKPIIGSYPISNSQSKLRISAFLNSPPDELMPPCVLQDTHRHQQDSNTRLMEDLSAINEPSKITKFMDKSSQKKQKPQKSDKPKSSILAISQELQSLTMLWKYKEQTSAQRFTERLLKS